MRWTFHLNLLVISWHFYYLFVGELICSAWQKKCKLDQLIILTAQQHALWSHDFLREEKRQHELIIL